MLEYRRSRETGQHRLRAHQSSKTRSGHHGERLALVQFSPVYEGWCVPGRLGRKAGDDFDGREPGRIVPWWDQKRSHLTYSVKKSWISF
jgi:hypothetical protein